MSDTPTTPTVPVQDVPPASAPHMAPSASPNLSSPDDGATAVDLRARIAELERDAAERQAEDTALSALRDPSPLEPRPFDQADDLDPYAPDDDAHDLVPGMVVRHTQWDPYVGAGGEDVERVGLVLEVTDTGARVAFLESAGPIAFDELTHDEA